MSRPPLIPHKTLQKIEVTFKRISDGMTPKKLMQFIFYRTNITYHITHVCRLMHKWNLKPKVPQKVHVRAASKDVCRKWNNSIISRIEKAKKKGFSVFIQDESVFVDDVRLGKKYWTDIHQRMIVQWRGSRQRFLVYKMMTIKVSLDRMKNLTQLHLWIIWMRLVKNLEKYLLSQIGHPQHKANDVKKYLRKNKDVKLACLPRGFPTFGYD